MGGEVIHGGCHVGMPVRTDAAPGSGCHARCLHRAGVLAYREAKVLADEVRKIERESATNGYSTEGLEWDASHPPLTFKAWLLDHRSPRKDHP